MVCVCVHDFVGGGSGGESSLIIKTEITGTPRVVEVCVEFLTLCAC